MNRARKRSNRAAQSSPNVSVQNNNDTSTPGRILSDRQIEFARRPNANNNRPSATLANNTAASERMLSDHQIVFGRPPPTTLRNITRRNTDAPATES